MPGDKSISHRALMLGAIAEGETRISGFLDGADCRATLSILRELGVDIRAPAAGELQIRGVGLAGLTAPVRPLDCGNSGTSMRLLAGLLAGQDFCATLTGDDSLRRRPMARIMKPLRDMGADIAAGEGDRAPLRITGRRPLDSIEYELPVASAQVKSAVLLAGLNARGVTRVIEPVPSRDHTERMLRGFGCPVERNGPVIGITGGSRLHGSEVRVPGDISSAAFLVVAAAMTPGAELLVRDVGVNPTRTGILPILERMGAQVVPENPREWNGEPVADLRVRGGRLHGTAIPPELVPPAIDEFPAILAAAAVAEGETLLTGAAELRVKESDRIAVMAEGLRALGIEAEPLPDGMRVRGGRPRGGEIDSRGDHRIAMAFAVLGSRATGPVRILDTANIGTSFPDFPERAGALGMQIRGGPASG